MITSQVTANVVRIPSSAKSRRATSTRTARKASLRERLALGSAANAMGAGWSIGAEYQRAVR